MFVENFQFINIRVFWATEVVSEEIECLIVEIARTTVAKPLCLVLKAKNWTRGNCLTRDGLEWTCRFPIFWKSVWSVLQMNPS